MYVAVLNTHGLSLDNPSGFGQKAVSVGDEFVSIRVIEHSFGAIKKLSGNVDFSFSE